MKILLQEEEKLLKQLIEYKQVEKSLRESERWLAATLKSIGEAVIATDNEGAVTFMNPVAEALTGWKQEEALGKEIVFKVIPEEISPPPENSAQKALQDGIIINITDHPLLIARDGTEIPIEYSGSPIKDDKGNISGVVLVFQDITARKRAEAALQEAKEATEVANRAKSVFLANMGHELRTPLNAILGYTQLLKESDNLTERQKRGLETINRSGEHLLTLITDILDISKIEMGRMELYPNEFDLPEFLKRIAEMTQIRAEQKGLSFVYERNPDLPGRIRADEKRLRQVLLNLLGNAVKFTKEGRVRFKVANCELRIANLEDRKSEIRNLKFEIEDTGAGIAPRKLEEIFLPFQQIDGHYHSVEGTGLGLAISRQLVEMMGGELHVESTVGKGSVFWFELNVPEVSGHMPQKEGSTQTSQSCQPSDTSPEPERRIETEHLPLVPFPPETTNRLLELAARGNPKKLIAELDNLGQMNEKYTPFVKKLCQLAKNYQIDQCIELLKTEEKRN